MATLFRGTHLISRVLPVLTGHVAIAVPHGPVPIVPQSFLFVSRAAARLTAAVMVSQWITQRAICLYDPRSDP